MRSLHTPVLVGLLALSALLAACTAEDLAPETTPIGNRAKVERPRVAMLSSDVAAISYDEKLESSDGAQLDRQLKTRLYSIPSGTSSGQEAIVQLEGFAPIAMSAGNGGYAISLANFAAGTGTQGCVHSTSAAATCTQLDTAASEHVAVTHADAGPALVLHRRGSSTWQRSYEPVSGWGASVAGPTLPDGDRTTNDASLVRGRDGSMFLAAFDPSKVNGVVEYNAIAVRFDPVAASWQPLARLGAADHPPSIALHPDAPTSSPIAVWYPPTGGIHYSVWQAGSGWSAGAPIPGSSPGVVQRAGRPTVAMWPNGDALVLWVDGPAADRRVIAASRIADAWQAPVPIGTTSGSPLRIAVGMDRFGNAVALWPNVGQLLSANHIVGKGWQSPNDVGFLADLNGSVDFDVAMEPGGRAVAVWAEPEAAGQPGSRLAIAPVGPSLLSLVAQRYAFGGEPVAVTVRLATPPTNATTLAMTSTFAAAQLSVPASVTVAANQSEVTLALPSSAVNDFVSGRIDVVYGNSSASQPVTLMPEPTGVSVTVAPAAVLGGETATVTVGLTPQYPTPLEVQLASTNPTLALVPARLTTSASSSTASYAVTTMTTFAAQSAVFTATFRNRVGTATLTINPTAPGTSTLTVALNQLIGNIVSNPAGINCGSTGSSCVASYPAGTQVSLMPSAGLAGQRFFAWQGDPDCSDGALTMSAARSCTAVFTPQPASYPPGVSWTFLGTPLVDGNRIDPQPALALDGLTPVIAYVSAAAGAPAQLYVRRLEVNTFAVVGTAALNVDPAKSASEPAIVTTSNGLPYVAWIEGSGAQQNLYVSRLLFGTGLTWGAVGAAGVPLNYTAGSRASSPSIALDAELRPMVAWIENGAVKFKRFDGTAWVAATGGEGPAATNADRVRLSSYSLAPGVTDPVLAWTEGSGLTRALKAVREFAFTSLGAQLNPASTSPLTQFAVLAEAGGGIVSWGLGDAPFTVRSQRWNGTAWVDVHANPPLAGASVPSHLTAIAMPKNALTVAALNAGPVPADGTGLLVSLRQPGGGWAPPLSFPFLGDATLESLGVELAADNSPVVVVVRRNAAGVYRWDVLRYFP